MPGGSCNGAGAERETAAGSLGRCAYPSPCPGASQRVGYRGERKNSHGHQPKELSRRRTTLGVRAPRGRSYADPTPIRRLGPAVHRSNWPTRIVTAPATARSARPNTHSPRMASTPARSSTRPSTASIRVRRYLCQACQRTVSLLPEFALPYLRFSVDGDRAVSHRPTAPRRKR